MRQNETGLEEQRRSRSPPKKRMTSKERLMSHGKIEIAGVSLEAPEVKKLASIIAGQHDGDQEATKMPYVPNGDPQLDQKLILKQTIADAKMTYLLGQTLDQKENIIKALEEELNEEKKRRKDFSKSYKDQVKEFDHDKKALDRIKKQSDQMELKQQRREKDKLKMENELDMVPVKEKSNVSKKNQLKDHPIFFKGSKITSVIPKQASGIGSHKKMPSAKA
jgi:hypothetical protein